ASTSGTPCTPAACGCCSPSWSAWPDRKSTRLNSSHRCISYAVFCLKKKKERVVCTYNRGQCMADPAGRNKPVKQTFVVQTNRLLLSFYVDRLRRILHPPPPSPSSR